MSKRWLWRSLRLRNQPLGAAYLVLVLRRREHVGGAAVPFGGHVLLLVVMMRGDVGRVVYIDEEGVGGFGLQVQAEHFQASGEGLVA